MRLPVLRLAMGMALGSVLACGGGGGPSGATTATPAPTPTPTPTPRATVDEVDEVSGYQVKALYVLPADGADERLDTNGTLARSLAAAQAWLHERTGKRLVLDTFRGQPDVAFVRLDQSDAELSSHGVFIRDQLERILAARGFDHPQKIYLVYFGGGAGVPVCANAAHPPRLVGQVTALYLKGTPPGALPCANNRFATDERSAGYLEFLALHEVFHVVGAVQRCAPQWTGDHVGDDPGDLMYAGSSPWRPARIDTHNDDYFRTGRADCLDVDRSIFLSPQAADAEIPAGWGFRGLSTPQWPADSAIDIGHRCPTGVSDP